jgi:PAS domain S-box-containing protein
MGETPYGCHLFFWFNAKMGLGNQGNQRAFNVRGTEILAADTLRQYRQKLARIALDEMYQFVAVLDPQGTLLEVNRAALEGAGLKLSDVEDKPFWDCFWWAVSKNIRKNLKHAVSQVGQGEFIRYDVEIFGRAHGKETIIIDFSMIPVKDENGTVVFIVAEGRDITEKNACEQEIASKNSALQALLERIRELDEIKSQFFANVNHELKTPLSLIIGPADRLMNSDLTLSTDQRQESARVIARNARLLLKHVNDLLEISKIEAGKFKIELQDTDLAALTRLVASHFDVLAEERTIQFSIEAPPEIILAIDPEKIQRVLMNLFSNAFKFVPEGGKIRVRFGPSKNSKNNLLIAVEDSGPGVKPELRKTIFERFRQGEGGTNRQFGGTGLGLAIAKEFLEMHHGSLEVLDSDLGGACFQVTLPMHLLAPVKAPALPVVRQFDHGHILEGYIEELRPGHAPHPAPEPIHSFDRTKPTVLVVEDNREMNRFISQALAGKYNIVSAFDGQQGLEKALAALPTLIVTDIMMPRVSGVEMIAEIRKWPELAEVPILLLSAKADEALKIELLENGAQDFVAKPFSEKDLLVRVRNLIRLKQATDKLVTASHAKDDFLAALSHELRTPLNPVLLLASEAAEDPGLSPDVRALFVTIRNSVELETRLIDDLLDITRITHGKLSLNLEWMDLHAILIEAVTTVQSELNQKRITLNLRLAAEHPAMKGDAMRMQQVFWNVLKNAVKFTPPGGTITIETSAKSGQLKIKITDTGLGMTAEELSAIFSPFSQGDHATDDARRFGGLGLGLTISRRLVELHLGQIRATSEGRGQGSTFLIELPLGKMEEAAVISPENRTVESAATQKANWDGTRILLVEDHEATRSTLAHLLTRRKFNPFPAGSLAEARRIAASEKIDFVISDIGLPDGNENALMAELSEQYGLKGIALTGYGMEQDLGRSLAAGFVTHLTKPIRMQDLETALRTHLAPA